MCNNTHVSVVFFKNINFVSSVVPVWSSLNEKCGMLLKADVKCFNCVSWIHCFVVRLVLCQWCTQRVIVVFSEKQIRSNLVV